MRVAVTPAEELEPGQLRRWSELQTADSTLSSPFFRPEYVQAVAAVRGDVAVAVVREDELPVAFFAFQRGRLGVGKPVGGILSDFQGVVAEPGVGLDPAALVRACGLRAWDFDHLLASQRAFAPHRMWSSTSPCIGLEGGFEAYRQARARAGSREIPSLQRKARKCAREIGELRFVAADPDPGALRTLMRWKSAHYRRTGAVAIFAQPWIVELMERLQGIGGPQFAGTLSTLYAGDRLIAAHMGMRSQDTWHWWLPSYDRELARYSPGLILLLRMAEEAQPLGMRLIDLGKGSEPYKQRFMTGAHALASGSIVASPALAAGRRLRAGLRAAAGRAVRSRRAKDRLTELARLTAARIRS